MRARLRKTLLFASLAGLIGFVLYEQAQERSAGSRTRPAAAPVTQYGARTNDSALPPSRTPLALPQRAPFGASEAEFFAARSWQPPAPPVVAAAPAPVPPPFPYRFAGTVSQGGEQVVLLSKGDAVFPAQAGETLDGLYRVESISETEISFLYLPLKHRHLMPIASSIAVASPGPQAERQSRPQELQAAAPAAAQSQAGPLQPAKLSWEGPSEVRVGAAFNVALKLKSVQPVQGSPMQIRFDPALLEALAVQPGQFFAAAARNFSYRVNPEGTIFVGASAAGPSAAADAELLILTFKAVKQAPEAQLGISSVSLTGSAGRPIAVEQLAAYRTSITR
jgi:cohesin domain-containing protein